jgi:hypothetical protein
MGAKRNHKELIHMPKDSTKTVKVPSTETEQILLTIRPPNLRVLPIHIRGTAPLVLCAFSEKARLQMREKQAAGSTARSRRGDRTPRDFEEMYQQARHISIEGRDGIPCAAFRAAAISTCRLIGFKMTIAKISIFVEPDSFDRVEGTGLVHISKGEPRIFESMGRNATGGPDIRVRPQWLAGWEATVRVRFDADQFTAQDVINLYARAGLQVGVGEGRPDSKDSAGQGWGTFCIVEG